MTTTTKAIKLSLIKLDAGTQSRAAINAEVVADYAERMTEGDKFPAVIVFHDGSDYFLADGFHRVLACERNKFKDVLADVRNGTREDALKFSLGANRSNGLRRTNADKRYAVELALKEFSDLSSNALAKLCGVSHTFVDSVRPQPATVASCETRKGADGKTRKMPAKRTGKPEDNHAWKLNGPAFSGWTTDKGGQSIPPEPPAISTPIEKQFTASAIAALDASAPKPAAPKRRPSSPEPDLERVELAQRAWVGADLPTRIAIKEMQAKL